MAAHLVIVRVGVRVRVRVRVRVKVRVRVSPTEGRWPRTGRGSDACPTTWVG